MKKKVLIFGYTMDMGGAERALINVINAIKDKCEIDLILLRDVGVLMKDIPDCVNVISIRKNIFTYAFFRYIPFFRKKTINKITSLKKYDIAVAFMEGRAATWLLDMNQDCKKIAWIHNDVNKFDIGIGEKEILDTYNRIDEIVVVSKQSKDSFCEKYNIDRRKVKVIYNLIDEKDILKKSSLLNVEKKYFTFINVAKMRPQKRHDRLLEAVSILKKEGYIFKLWLIGNGPLERDIKNKIEKLNIADYVEMLGLKENPFPYIKVADYFVMSSDHEGYPLSLLESLLLKTPVISTDVSGAREILDNGKYGVICDISLDSLVSAMKTVLDNKNISKFENNLLKYEGANGNIVNQLEDLFEI